MLLLSMKINDEDNIILCKVAFPDDLEGVASKNICWRQAPRPPSYNFKPMKKTDLAHVL